MHISEKQPKYSVPNHDMVPLQHRTKILDKNACHVIEKKWAGGREASKKVLTDLTAAFEAAKK